MRLAFKFTLAFVTILCTTFLVVGYDRVLREIAFFERDIIRDHRVLAKGLASAASGVWSHLGEEAAADFIARADQDYPHLKIRFVPSAAWSGPVSGDSVVSAREKDEEGKWIRTRIPLAVDGANAGAVEIRESLAEESRYVRWTVMRVIITTSVIIVLSGIAMTVLGVVFVGRPVQQLVRVARRIAEGDLSEVPMVTHQDELGQLSRELGTMARRLAETERRAMEEKTAREEIARQLQHANRLTTVGVLASSIAHELGTPLNVVAARARMIESKEIEGEAAQRSARIICQQADRMTGSIRQLLDYARKPTPKQQVVDLRQVAQQTCELFGALAVRHSVSIDLRLGPEPLLARVDPGQIQQALSNVVLNGIQAMPGGGPLVVEVSAPEDPSKLRNGICMSVVDHGAGITAENVPRVFESFFTTKADSGGTGLGLSIAHEIIAEHHGWIDIESTPGKGTRFRIFLPDQRGA